MEDIAPDLLLRLRASFRKRMEESSQIQALLEKIQSGGGTYGDAQNYAYQIGQALSQAFGENLSSAVLPDGRMYYNIASRVLEPLLEEDHSIISQAAKLVQQFLNQKAGIGIQAQTAPVNADRIAGIVDKISNGESFEDVAWVLDEPIKNFSMNVVDETIRQNVNFQGKSGLRPKVIRKSERKCCPWCSNLAGEYEYPDVPDDVYRRHENCRCTVEYDPGSGKRQNVHTKKWTTDGQRDMIEEEIVSLLSQSMAFYALSGEVDSKEDVLSREIYTILINLAKQRIKSLNQTRDTLASEIINVSKNITQIQNSIQEQTKKRDTLEGIKAKQEQIIASMQEDLKVYNQKLQDINTERKNLDSILANLKITQEQNHKKIQEKIQKEEQAQASTPKPKRTIQASKDIKIASSAYKDISTASYRGSKTIPPLAPNTFRIEQKFGPTFDPVYKMKFFYENIILVPKNRNADVKNVLDGKVVFAKENPVIKKVVIIEHKDSLYTVYAYMDRISDTIKPGVFVKKGYTIGKVNEKLSFEVTQKDKHIDPLQLIKIQ